MSSLKRQKTMIPIDPEPLNDPGEDTNIGVWESTTELQRDETETPPMTEEDKAQDTLNALEELPGLMEELEKDATRYDLHVKIIDLLEKADVPDQLEYARQQMHKLYPLTEDMWLKWIQDTKKSGDEEKLKELYEEAQKDYLSIPIWKDYVEYFLEKFYAKWGEDGSQVENEQDVAELIESTRNQLLKAVAATRNHVAQSHEIWNKYADFERQILEKFKEPDQLERLKALYDERLKIVHTACEETFNRYSNLISSWDNANYEETMVQKNKLYAGIKKAAEERDFYERKLAQNGYSLEVFYEYIDYEKGTDKKSSLNHVQNLYERAISIYCTDVMLWNDYICFLLENARVYSVLETVLLRSLRNCPWSGFLWAHMARVMELENRPKEQVLEIFDRALGNETLRSSLEDMVTVFLAKCDYLRNLTEWDDSDSVNELRLAFEEALVYLEDSFPGSGDPYFRIEKRYAFIEGFHLHNYPKSTELWERIVKRYGRSTDTWLEYIQFERLLGRTNIARGLFRRAIPKNLDQPQKFMDAYMAMEHEIGNADTITDMLLRISTKNRTLTAQWQAEARAQAAAEAAKPQRPAKRKRGPKKPRSAAAEPKVEQQTPMPQAAEDEQIVQQSTNQTVEEDKIEQQKSTKEDNIEPEANTSEQIEHMDTTQDQPASRKRKASEISEENETNDKTEESGKRLRSSKEEEKGPKAKSAPRRGPRPRGRARKAIRLGGAISRRNQPQDQRAEEAATVPATSLSNDDFRAMLLGKK